MKELSRHQAIAFGLHLEENYAWEVFGYGNRVCEPCGHITKDPEARFCSSCGAELPEADVLEEGIAQIQAAFKECIHF
jgi:rRNA maturation endonuclease Nob1